MSSPNAVPQPVPNQPAAAKPKKPIWKRWWFWLIVVVAVLAIAGSQMSGSDKGTTSTPSSTTSQQSSSGTDKSSANRDAGSAESKQSDKQSEEPHVPADYRSALRQADTYANQMHMSKAKLYDQLISEYGGKFSAQASQYAVDNVKADWNANALAMAKNYQETMAMSPEAIRDQLTSDAGEKFTAEEMDYAIQHFND